MHRRQVRLPVAEFILRHGVIRLRYHPQGLGFRVHLDDRTVRDGRRHVFIEARQHGDVAQRGTLRQNRIDGIEDDRHRCHVARLHFV